MSREPYSEHMHNNSILLIVYCQSGKQIKVRLGYKCEIGALSSDCGRWRCMHSQFTVSNRFLSFVTYVFIFELFTDIFELFCDNYRC